MLQQITEEF